MELREFTGHDWDGWAGACRTEQGDLPMIGEAVIAGWEDYERRYVPSNARCSDYDEVNPDCVTVIVDANGIGLYGMQDCWLCRECSYEHAVAAAKAIITRSGEIIVDDLLVAGFSFV